MQQELFEITTESGSQVCFAVMGEQQCGILCDGNVVETFTADDAGIDRGLRKYFRLIEARGGARHPFQVLEHSCGHPHAG